MRRTQSLEDQEMEGEEGENGGEDDDVWDPLDD